ncbi:trypsin-like serine protease, partial [Kibdelosporangium philippinense]
TIVQPGSELCVYGTTSATACYGDSGGPALVQANGGWQLVGATSRSGGTNSTCGTGTDNAVYTDVVAYRQWIDSTIGGGEPCQAVAWRSGVNYPPGSAVSFQNAEWQAQYWTYGQAPGQSWVWQPIGEC